ncbi:MAG TPA: NAD(+) synthase [Planctomycetota bacterium]|nr:NAD(+) synthase [Planctomycetota bacterium]
MAQGERSFFDLYAHGMARVALAVPRLVLADPAANAAEVERLWRQAGDEGAVLAVFPELALSGYSIDDLHQQQAVLGGVREALADLAQATRSRSTILVVGAPLRFDGRLFNCAVVLHAGQALGVVPKSYLPSYREFYEKRQFAAARDALAGEVELLGRRVPFGPDLIFRARGRDDFALHAEVCEDVWVPLPPSSWAALGGATLLANLSASNVTVGKSLYRRQLAASQSAKCIAAYLYAAAGPGESTTDLAWDGHAMVYENGLLLAESERFAEAGQLVLADVDLEKLVQDRMRMTSWIDCASDHRAALARLRTVELDLELPAASVPLSRAVERFPYVPSDPATRDERCREVYQIQVSALAQRLSASGVEKVVVGVSGGLDSTQALVVAARAMDRLGAPRRSVLAYSMPGFATSRETRANAQSLARALEASFEEIDIRPACERMLSDIGHPFARGEALYDTTFENVQAGERTSHLFRLANRHDALVVGTGDLSELALGWCTYGVGDQMSHYGVNASVPKTLVRHLIEWVAERREAGDDASEVLRRILETDISPELVPGDDDGAPSQKTEELIGPYELHDFSLYHVTRLGYGPAKVAFLAARAWARDVPGADPSGGGGGGAYSMEEILRWLEVFLDRFFRTSQFKRSALPNGPKVGSGGSLSPRGDWRAPSDAGSGLWLRELERTRAWVARSLPG